MTQQGTTHMVKAALSFMDRRSYRSQQCYESKCKTSNIKRKKTTVVRNTSWWKSTTHFLYSLKLAAITFLSGHIRLCLTKVICTTPALRGGVRHEWRQASMNAWKIFKYSTTGTYRPTTQTSLHQNLQRCKLSPRFWGPSGSDAPKNNVRLWNISFKTMRLVGVWM